MLSGLLDETHVRTLRSVTELSLERGRIVRADGTVVAESAQTRLTAD